MVIGRTVLILMALGTGCVQAADGPSTAAAWRIEQALTRQASETNAVAARGGVTRPEDASLWFYAERSFAPAWNWGDRLPRLLRALQALEEDGLEPDLYGLPELQRRWFEGAEDPAQIACTDLMATEAYLGALFDLSFGRLDPASIEPIWHAGQDTGAREQRRLQVIMLAAGLVDDIEDVIARVRPSTPGYRGLRQGYAELRERARAGDWPTVPAGPLLRPGMRDPRVPALRSRLADEIAAAAPEAAQPELYDADVVAAITAFQRRHHLQPDGMVGPETLAALNVPIEARLEQLRVNLERMRWLAVEQEQSGLVVDIAGGRILYRRDGAIVWSARTQVGRASRPTPRLKSAVTHLTFNPSWTVPPTILREDKLPLIRKDISYLERNRLRVLDHAGNRLDPVTVDWSSPGGILLRQDPGPHNALGRVAIRFPNPFHVYLHDTPSQAIFQLADRGVSSGCVRVERPMELADLLIEDGSDAGPERAAGLAADGRTRDFYLARPIPILVAYWTADVGDDGRVVFRPDRYGRDPGIARALAEQVPRLRWAEGCAAPRERES